MGVPVIEADQLKGFEDSELDEDICEEFLSSYDILLDAIFINQLVHFLVEAYALPDESPGTEDGADEIHCGFINFFSADLLFKHAFGMIYWHRELVVKEFVKVRAEVLVSGVDVSNAFPSENDGEATL